MAMPQLIMAMQTLQNNSFLQNLGQGLLNSSNFGDISILFDQLNGQSNQISAIQNQVINAQASMGAPLEEALLQVKLGSDKIMELQNTANIGAEALKELDNAASGIVDGGLVKLVKEGKEAQKQLDELEKTVGKALEQGLIEAPKVLNDNAEALDKIEKSSEKTQTQLSGVSGIFSKMYVAALQAGGGLTGAAAAVDVLKISVLEFLSVTGPFLLIGAAIAAIAYAVGKAQEEAEKAKQNVLDAYEEAKSKLEEIKSIQEQIEGFNEKYSAFKENGKGKQELIEEAENVAKALKEAGAEEEAQQVALAATTAEVNGTAEAYAELYDVLQRQGTISLDKANVETANDAIKVVYQNDDTLDEIFRKEQELKYSRQQLNNLKLEDPGYELQKHNLEELIETNEQ